MELHVDEWGTGPKVVLVHGAMMPGPVTWKRQQPLAARWRLTVPTRRGFVPNPPAERSDFDVDANDMIPLLAGGAHVVGHSYGGLIALMAAAQRPADVRSLCLLEPATHALLRGDPELEASIERHERILREDVDPREFLEAFLGEVGSTGSLPDPLPPDMARHAELLMHERVPYDADIPSAVLRAAPFPILVVSGDHLDLTERVCDATADALGAPRAVLAGAGHQIPRADGCNELLEQWWSSAG